MPSSYSQSNPLSALGISNGDTLYKMQKNRKASSKGDGTRKKENSPEKVALVSELQRIAAVVIIIRQ